MNDCDDIRAGNPRLQWHAPPTEPAPIDPLLCMFHRARVVKLQPGACPIVQDSLPSEVFYVTDGTIKLTRVGLGGRETILGVHGSGSILGAEQAVAGTRHCSQCYRHHGVHRTRHRGLSLSGGHTGRPGSLRASVCRGQQTIY